MTTHKAKILVVDDEERFRKSLCRLLRAEGYTVEPAENGHEALNKLATNQFDVVLLDMKMPGMSGAETFSEIQLQGFDVETVCLTGHTSITDAMKLLHNGVFDYLLKPASLPEIVETVQRAMERKLLRHGAIGMSELIGGSADK
ncbi:response regulator [Pseudodesulfovibrio thermohalotolerans]|uniref:sigma-54-dependent transcriptional regulator n=1 Tax=Pseudodesulfovibrio thermohalotolerans TaxID=2880651 RepID=UPI0022B9DD4B|nr:response regulator [Pseudodesulfovibrio thermohalotolerans]WFS61779.1 response regulator [Pseudodesulfovibrio thermohalotolerans]